MQHFADAFEDDQRPQNEEHRARHLQLVLVDDALQRVGQIAHAHVLHIERGEVLDELREVGFEGAHVGDVGRQGQAAEVEGHVARVLPGHADEHARKGVLLLLGEAPHHAEVNEHQRTIGAHQHVAGVGVGVEKPELKYLGQVDVHARFGHLGGVEAPGQQLRLVGDFAALHELDNQNAAGAQLAVGPGDVERGVAFVELAHLLHGAGFGGVVQLLAHAALKGIHHVLGVGQALLAQEAGREAHQLVQEHEVGAHFFAHAGALHLHHHFLAGGQPRPVHLPDAGRAQRHVVELAEHLRQRSAQLLLDKLPGLRHRKRRHVALQLLKLVNQGLRQQVGAVAERLRELDERGPQLLNAHPNPLPARGVEHGPVGVLPAAAAAAGHQPPQGSGGHHVLEAVAQQHLRHLTDAAEVGDGVFEHKSQLDADLADDADAPAPTVQAQY